MKDFNPIDTVSRIVRNTEEIFHGALVGISTIGITDGRIVNWNDTSGALDFIGIADPNADSVTGDANGTVECPIISGGVELESVTVTGVDSADDVGDPVYATDENTFTLTATTNVGAIGWVTRQITGTTVDIRIFSEAQYRANQDRGQV
jgi:hypothetical protein